MHNLNTPSTGEETADERKRRKGEAQGWRCQFCGGVVRMVDPERGVELPEDAAVLMNLVTRLHMERGTRRGKKVVGCWTCCKKRDALLTSTIPLSELHDRAQGAGHVTVKFRPLRPAAAQNESWDAFSLAAHEQAIEMIKSNPVEMIARARRVLSAWDTHGNAELDAAKARWEEILCSSDWASVLALTEEGYALRRRRSPIASLLPKQQLHQAGKAAGSAQRP